MLPLFGFAKHQAAKNLETAENAENAKKYLPGALGDLWLKWL
jgi:hypothetical protein